MPADVMPADELRAWFRHIEYQQRVIIWALSKHKTPKPKPPEGIIR